MSEPAIPDELVRLYRETNAVEAQRLLTEVRWGGPEPSAEANAAADAAFWEATRAGLAAVLARLSGPGDTEGRKLAELIVSTHVLRTDHYFSLDADVTCCAVCATPEDEYPCAELVAARAVLAGVVSAPAEQPDSNGDCDGTQFCRVGGHVSRWWTGTGWVYTHAAAQPANDIPAGFVATDVVRCVECGAMGHAAGSNWTATHSTLHRDLEEEPTDGEPFAF